MCIYVYKHMFCAHMLFSLRFLSSPPPHLEFIEFKTVSKRERKIPKAKRAIAVIVVLLLLFVVHINLIFNQAIPIISDEYAFKRFRDF